MLELAILFVVISAITRVLGPDYANVADATLSMAGLFAVMWLVASAIALMVSRPLDRGHVHRHA